jgi:hypothetical protein
MGVKGDLPATLDIGITTRHQLGTFGLKCRQRALGLGNAGLYLLTGHGFAHGGPF